VSKRNPGKKKSDEKNGVAENAAGQVPATINHPVLKERLERLFPGIRHAKKRKWLAAVASTGQLRVSQRLTGIDRRFHYLWMEKDPDYPAAYEKARSIAADAAEDEVWRRGVDGIERPLSFKGKLTGHYIREYSDNLLMFRMKGERPDKYREDSRLQININTPPAVNFLLPANPEIDVTEESED
jgi:hypothetical protein